MAKGSAVNHDDARELLAQGLRDAEGRFADGTTTPMSDELELSFDQMFASQTKAYREVALGCLVVRLKNLAIDICKPYAKLGQNAFSGRSLDEQVINPFLQDHRFPCTKGPYLSVFRRTVGFNHNTRQGLRDVDGYDALLAILRHASSLSDEHDLYDLYELFVYLLIRLVRIRDAAIVPLTSLPRVSLDQIDALVAGLLETPSGGRIPVLLAVAGFESVIDYFKLDWALEVQGINVADAASGSHGDLTIRQAGKIILAVEVTERAVDRSRLVATFNTKIVAQGIEDYVFLTASPPSEDVKRQSYRYFAQGHELNFALVRDWIKIMLITTGRRGRELFHRRLVRLLDQPDIPASLKIAWNRQVERITTAF